MSTDSIVRFSAGKQELSLAEVRRAIATTPDVAALRDAALQLLDKYMQLARAVAAGAPISAPQQPTVVFEPGAINLTVTAPASPPSNGVTIDRDQEGRVIGTTPKSARFPARKAAIGFKR